jgi:long-chain fatty acid transport protein
MRKSLTLMGLVLGVAALAFPAIVTNTNQSAFYLRHFARNASTDIDAVYYNPAGLTKLSDGFHLALHNQTIFQEKTVINDFPTLNAREYVGDVNVPIFPTFFAVYKKGNFAVSFGFGPNAGGGTADFKKGLPSFEIPIAQLPAMISSMAPYYIQTTKYAADIALKGSSVYYGFQVNAAYALSDAFTLGFGIRYISAVNTYEGHLNSIMINPNFPPLGLTGGMIPATAFFTAAGLPAYAAMVADKSVDVKQEGTAWTPIWSLFVTPFENFHFSFRYENGTSLELKNKTTKDDTGMFPNGVKTGNDIPAILALGADYAFSPKFRASLSFNYYLDKDADWDGREQFVDDNSYEVALGLEYQITDMIGLSAGYLLTQYGLSAAYQTDMSHSLSADTIGAGVRIKIGANLDLDLAGFYVSYKDASKSIAYPPFGSFKETYKRTTVGFGIGFGYRI